MGDVGVWSESGEIYRRLQASLGQSRHRLLWARHPSQLALRPLELLIIAPSAKALAGAGAITSPFALLPGRTPSLCRWVQALSAVSYGLGSKNTLTYSSLEGEQVSLALQRELITLSGQRIDPQEWVLPLPQGSLSPEEFLCLTGAQLLLDQSPETSS